jgi:hypothetical protein
VGTRTSTTPAACAPPATPLASIVQDGVMLDYETESSDRPTASVAQFGATWHAAARALQANGHTLEMCIDLYPDVNPSCVNLTKVTYGTLWTYTNFIPFSNGFTDMVCCFFILLLFFSSLPCLLIQTLLFLLSDRGALQGEHALLYPLCLVAASLCSTM